MAPPSPHSNIINFLNIDFLNEANFARVQRLLSQQEERQRLGTSAKKNGEDGPGTRTNAKAEALAKQAGDLKITHVVAGAAGGERQYYEQALALYTQAIDLDPFNHMYFYHRAQLFLECNIPLASMDAKFALDLLYSNRQMYVEDDIFCSLWLILVESELRICELHNARRFVQDALSVVPPTQALRRRLQMLQRVIQQGLNEIQRRLEMDHGNNGGATSSIPVSLRTVMDDGDDYMFVYTSQLRFVSPSAPVPMLNKKKIQPELLAVDLPAEMITNGDIQLMFHHVISKELPDISAFVAVASSSSIGRRDNLGEEDEQEKQQQVMEAFQMPDGRYSITPILVVRQDDCQVLQRHLMCDCRDDCHVVVLKVDMIATTANKKRNKNRNKETVTGNGPIVTDGDDGPVTVEKKHHTLSELHAKAYVAKIVENAPTCQEFYKKGIKLADEYGMLHELSKRMSNLISSTAP
jgi:tetratricopeptide (TPR) repeat protein